jgi:hypothetical protein
MQCPQSGDVTGSARHEWLLSLLGLCRFEIIFFFSALSQMFVDQAYWQSAIAARATSAVKVGPSPFYSKIEAQLCILTSCPLLWSNSVSYYKHMFHPHSCWCKNDQHSCVNVSVVSSASACCLLSDSVVAS